MRKRKRITHRQIAEACGVACSSVTRVLTSHPSVSREMREQVINTARKLGYQFRQTTKSQQRIAVIINNFGTQSVYSTEIISALQNAVQRQKWGMVVFYASDVKNIPIHQFNGIISLAYDPAMEKFLAENYNIPVVTINSNPRHIDRIYSVYSDEIDGVTQAFRHLVKLKHQKIAVFYHSSGNFVEKKREKALNLITKNDNIDSEFIYVEKDQELKFAIEKAFDSGFTAGILFIEMPAIVLQNLFLSLRIRIPEDFSIIAKETLALAEYIAPKPCSLNQNMTELAKSGVKMIELVINNKERQVKDVSIKYIFNPGSTTCVARNRRS